MTGRAAACFPAGFEDGNPANLGFVEFGADSANVVNPPGSGAESHFGPHPSPSTVSPDPPQSHCVPPNTAAPGPSSPPVDAGEAPY